MRLVNYDVVQYIIIQTMRDLQKAGRDDLAELVRGLGLDLAENLDEILVEKCPFCRGRFSIARLEDFEDED